MKAEDTKKAIASFFDDASASRDQLFLREPVLGYEQETRQRAVLDLLDPQVDDTVLDIGCGNARDGRVLARHVGLWVGTDLSVGMLIEAREVLRKQGTSGPVTLADAMHLPFSPESFDKVYCSEVIEHIPDWPRIVPEIWKVLKPGGRVIFTTPNRESIYRPIRVLMDFVRRLQNTHRVHPYDEWKTLSEVTRVLGDGGFVRDRALGVCFVPGQWAYVVPRGLQRAVISLTRVFEPLLRERLPGRGYLLAVSATKAAVLPTLAGGRPEASAAAR
jgi:ubiquinone/menaquinone biosynthesis C-methylase UbiE